MAADHAKPFDLSGRVAVVTGGGRGLGRTIAEGLAQFGAELVLCGRTGSTLSEAAAAIRAAGGRAHVITADVSQELDVLAVRDFTLERTGRIDVLVNNAGIDPVYRATAELTKADWDPVIGTNLTGAFLCARYLGAEMARREGGSIVSISSIAGHVGLRKHVPYCASKGGLELMTKALAIEWAKARVRVNCIAPGFLETDLTAAMLEHEHLSKRLLAHVPMERFGKTRDVVGAVVFLASEASSYVTGHSLVVDGGWTAD
jgi:NAD(P)-dependent dehydrogenase (short-subunit alcohol dehydrogenase family)